MSKVWPLMFCTIVSVVFSNICLSLSAGILKPAWINSHAVMGRMDRAGSGCWWNKNNKAGKKLKWNTKTTTMPYTSTKIGVCIQPCIPGTFGTWSRILCQTCAVGRASNIEGLVSDNLHTGCTACVVGKFQLDTPTVCNSCPTGWFQDDTIKSTCKKCEAGKFNAATGSVASSACTDCTPGMYQNLPNSETCLSCVVGQFTNTAGQTSCKKCSIGQYQDQETKIKCKVCPVGRFNVRR